MIIDLQRELLFVNDFLIDSQFLSNTFFTDKTDSFIRDKINGCSQHPCLDK